MQLDTQRWPDSTVCRVGKEDKSEPTPITKVMLPHEDLERFRLDLPWTRTVAWWDDDDDTTTTSTSVTTERRQPEPILITQVMLPHEDLGGSGDVLTRRVQLKSTRRANTTHHHRLIHRALDVDALTHTLFLDGKALTCEDSSHIEWCTRGVNTHSTVTSMWSHTQKRHTHYHIKDERG